MPWAGAKRPKEFLKMALKPSKIMSWEFTRELSCRNRQRDSYAKRKANEAKAAAWREQEAAKAKEMRKCR